jgi:hypothetical protein
MPKSSSRSSLERVVFEDEDEAGSRRGGRGMQESSWDMLNRGE